MSVKTQKMIIGACLAFLVVFWGYKFIKGEPDPAVIVDGSEMAPVDPETEQAMLASQEIVALSERLQNIAAKNDKQELFNDKSFKSLVDFTVTLFVETAGRPNPFAAIGFDSTSFVSQPVLQPATTSGLR